MMGLPTGTLHELSAVLGGDEVPETDYHEYIRPTELLTIDADDCVFDIFQVTSSNWKDMTGVHDSEVSPPFGPDSVIVVPGSMMKNAYIGHKHRVYPMFNRICLSRGWSRSGQTGTLNSDSYAPWWPSGDYQIRGQVDPKFDIPYHLGGSLAFEPVLNSQLPCACCGENLPSGSTVKFTLCLSELGDKTLIEWKGMYCPDHSKDWAMDDAFGLRTAQRALYKSAGQYHTYLAEIEYDRVGCVPFSPDMTDAVAARFTFVNYRSRVHPKQLYYGPNWGEIREQVIQRDSLQCCDCEVGREEHREEYGSDLHVHHIRPFRSFNKTAEANQLDNLITLCASCHPKHESKTHTNRGY